MYPLIYSYLSSWAYLFKGCGETIDGGLSTAVNLVARNTTEIWYSINFVLKGAWDSMINGIIITYNNLIIIKSCVLVVSSLQTFSFWILSKWSNMHAAFQISGFFAASAIFEFRKCESVDVSQKKFRNFFYIVCPISSLVTQHTIAKTTGYRNWSLLFVISTVAGDGPDLTDLILEDIEKFTSLIVRISSKVTSEKRFRAS